VRWFFAAGGLIWWLGLGVGACVLVVIGPWWAGWLLAGAGGAFVAPGVWWIVGSTRRSVSLGPSALVVRGWLWRQDVTVPRALIRRFDSVEYSDGRMSSILWLVTLQQLFWQLEVRLQSGDVLEIPSTFASRRAIRRLVRQSNAWLEASAVDDQAVSQQPSAAVRIENTRPRWVVVFPWCAVGLGGLLVAGLLTIVSHFVLSESAFDVVRIVAVSVAAVSGFVAAFLRWGAKPLTPEGRLDPHAL